MTGEDDVQVSSGSSPVLRLRHRGRNRLTELQGERRRRVIERISVAGPGRWLWTGQAKRARGSRYPQIMHTLPGGAQQLLNARHVVFYLATGWVPEDVQRYRARDGDALNVHPDNIIPAPPVVSPRRRNNLWDVERLQEYYG